MKRNCAAIFRMTQLKGAKWKLCRPLAIVMAVMENWQCEETIQNRKQVIHQSLCVSMSISRVSIQLTRLLNQGPIGQDTLTTMIRQDEMPPSSRSRRRNYYLYSIYSDLAGKLQYPSGKSVLFCQIKS